MPENAKSTRRRWWQVSLRGLLIGSIVASLGFAWIHHVHQRREARRSLSQLNLEIDVQPAPPWLRAVIGEWSLYFDRAERVAGRVPAPETRWAEQVGYLTSVRELDFRDCPQLTDRHVACWTGLAHLQSLDLTGSAVTDRGVRYLRGHRHLRKLWLGRTRITRVAANELSRLRELEYLDLSETDVDSIGVAALVNHPRLERVDVSGTRIDDRAMKTLATLTRLRRLNVAATAVGDDGVAAFSADSQLECLWLAGTRVTDKGVATLRRHRWLHFVSLGQTAATAASADVLVELPALRKAVLIGQPWSPEVRLMLSKRGLTIVE